ncbi:MAG: hypothetical protein WBQ25_22165 [Nitrososphaeraceae archaeon]
MTNPIMKIIAVQTDPNAIQYLQGNKPNINKLTSKYAFSTEDNSVS